MQTIFVEENALMRISGIGTSLGNRSPYYSPMIVVVPTRVFIPPNSNGMQRRPLVPLTGSIPPGTILRTVMPIGSFCFCSKDGVVPRTVCSSSDRSSHHHDDNPEFLLIYQN